ncbi:phosphate ABC transporter permease PstA [bacterium]|nr:phosphate ABC transporter permease PstA [bacterium]
MKAKPWEKAGLWGIRVLTYMVVLGILFVLGDIVTHGAPAVTWEFLTAMPSKAGAEGGILPAIVGTLCLLLVTIVVALPIGMGAAIYLSEYAGSDRLTEWIRLAIFTLAGVPSIVFGLLGLGLFVIFLGFGASILAGSLTLAIMILPVIIVSSEEALRTVPQSLRDGSLALGATRWQTVWRNVLPYSFPGMLTGSILGIARAAGETAPILFTVAAFYLPRLPSSVFDQVMALPYHLYILATQHPDLALVRPKQYATALVLVTIVLGVNLCAIILRNYFRKKYCW